MIVNSTVCIANMQYTLTIVYTNGVETNRSYTALNKVCGGVVAGVQQDVVTTKFCVGNMEQTVTVTYVNGVEQSRTVQATGTSCGTAVLGVQNAGPITSLPTTSTGNESERALLLLGGLFLIVAGARMIRNDATLTA